MHIQENVSLKPYHTFGMEVSCRRLIKISTTEDISTYFKTRPEDQKFMLLGEGSNVLFTKAFNGDVLLMSIPGIEVLSQNKSEVLIKVGAGIIWDDFVNYCVKNKYYGIENLSLIPGTVGAAPIQNIGAYGTEVKEVIEEVHFYNIEESQQKVLLAKECQFGYRNSIFKNELQGKIIITSVVFRLKKQADVNLKYKGINEALNELQLQPSLENVRKAVIHVRETKLPDPKEYGNAGSFFKNPVIPDQQFQDLKSKHPSIPSYPDQVGMTKIPAAWLIDQCGWKGKQIGNVAVHKNQPLVLINLGNAKPEEIIFLSSMIQSSVEKTFGISLEPEVRFI